MIDHLSRDYNLERSALHWMLMKGIIDPRVHRLLFAGEERKLYDAMMLQWQNYGKLDKFGLKNEHSCLVDVLQSVANLSDYTLDKLKKHYIRREVGELFLKNDYSDDVIEDNVRSIASEIACILTSGVKTYDHQSEMLKLSEAVTGALKSKSGIAGLQIGIPDLDRLINGIESSKVYYIGALKKTGKSRFMVHCACALNNLNKHIYINSLEMSSNQLNVLGLSHYSNIDSALVSGVVPTRLIKDLNIGFSAMADMKWEIYRDYYLADVRNRIIYLKQKGRCDVVFIDYIQRMKTREYRSDRTRQVEQIAMGIADISRECEVPIICFTQLRGEAEKLDPADIPDMSYMKESQGIAESGDVLMIMHNYDRKKESVYTDDGAYIFPDFGFKVQQRYGLSNIIVKAKADLRTCKFYPENSVKPNEEF